MIKSHTTEKTMSHSRPKFVIEPSVLNLQQEANVNQLARISEEQAGAVLTKGNRDDQGIQASAASQRPHSCPSANSIVNSEEDTKKVYTSFLTGC